jgi:hypothetical protein
MPEFHVTWETVLDAADHREAASRALAIQRNPESIATVFAVRDLHSADSATYEVDLGGDYPVEPSLTASQAAAALRAADWPAVAEDLDAGRPVHEILAWLRETPECAFAAAIVCRIHEDEHPAITAVQREASALAFAVQLYTHDSYCGARNFDLGQHHGPDRAPTP